MNQETELAGKPKQKWGFFLDLAMLALWAMTVAALLANNQYTLYLVPGFWPLLVLALVLLSIGFVTKFALGHSGHRGSPSLRFILLCLPLIYLASSYGETLGAFAFSKRSAFILPGVISGFENEPNRASQYQNDDAEPMEVNLVGITWNFVRLSKRQVITIGQVTWDDETPKGYFVLFRFVINCCVADAQPVAILVRHEDRESLVKNGWVRVTGRVKIENIEDLQAITIQADSVNAIEQPENIYLYTR